VVVLNFTSNSAALTDYIIEELTGFIVNDGSLTVVDRRNLEIIRQELEFQLSGEVSDETAQSIGQKLGAQTIISGSITAIGATYRLRIRAIAVETAAIQGMHNVTVAQDSTIAALTGGVYTPPSTAVTTAKPATPSTPPQTSAAASSLIPLDIEWEATSDNGGKSSASVLVKNEIIEGYQRVVLEIDSNLASGKNPWLSIGFDKFDNSTLQRLKGGSGIRFKALGDGKTWVIHIGTSDVKDYCWHGYRFNTKKDKVVTVEFPYSKLRQADWGKKVSFNKNNIVMIEFFRNIELSMGKAAVKVFDFEVY
jgi:hypothetical protein